MEKVNDIITIIKNYNKILELTGGNIYENSDIVINMLKKYKNLTIEQFEQKLEGENSKSKTTKLSQRQQAIDLGKLYYDLRLVGKISEEQQRAVDIYLALPENEILMKILNVPFEQTYKVINESSDKSLLVNHLAFLGMALLNIKLKSGSKAIQKKNLLDVLWKVIENQKMNEIYESAL